MEIFIEEVRQHECLWNPTSPYYKDSEKREASWRAIIQTTNMENSKYLLNKCVCVCIYVCLSLVY